MDGGEDKLLKLMCFAVHGEVADATGKENSTGILTSAHEACEEFMSRDYNCEILPNENGFLCGTYPVKIIVPTSKNNGVTVSSYKDYVLKGRFARTRSRFVVPVLMLNDKYVCRSSTLARSPEIYYRHSYGYWMNGEKNCEEIELSGSQNGKVTSNGVHSNPEQTSENGIKTKQSQEDDSSKEWLLDKMRNADINLLRHLRVDTIFDLMVENRKVKFGMNVTSSEKVDKQERYLRFHLLSVPYPGCEFFAQYSSRDYCAEGLMFDWTQTFVDAGLNVPKKLLALCDAPWDKYTDWDLVQLTKNYLLLHLRSLVDKSSSGVLLHCISGWDRTPLFISLMRLSLWADGLVHQSLNPEEMVYFTVAYDWLLFNHRFSDRIANGEEIFYFCFDFLKYIYDDEFSMLPFSNDHNISNGTSIEPQETTRSPTETEVSSNSEIIENHIFSDFVQFSASDRKHKGSADVAEEAGESSFVVDNDNESSSSPQLEVNSEVYCNGHKVSNHAVVESENGDAEISPVLSDTVDTSACLEEPTASNGEVITLLKTRREKLKCARELVVNAYQAAMQWHRDQEQTNSVGFASTLFNHLSQTLNLGKR